MPEDPRGNGAIDIASTNLVDLRDELISLADQARSHLKDGWQENLEHLAGYLITSTRGAMHALTNTEYKEQFTKDGSFGTVTVANRIFPAANRLLARTLGMINGFQVTPATSDERDKDAAKGAEKLSLAQWHSERIFDEVSQAVLFSFATSHGFILQEGDATLDEPEAVYEDEDSEEKVEIPTGRVVRRVLIPTDVNPLPGIRKLEDSPVIHVRMPMYYHDIMRRWGGDDGIGDAKLKKLLAKAPMYKHSMDRLNNLEPNTDSAQIQVDRMWWKPDRKAGWPSGKMAVLIGDTVVWEDKEWIGVGEKDRPRSCMYPIIDFPDVPVNLGYWGRGRQTIARPAQKILNIAWTKASQVASLPGVMIAVPLGSQIETAKITNAPVSIMKYNTAGGGGISFWTPPRMDLYEYVIEKSSQWIDEAFSQPPPSRGVSPGSRFPATGLQTLIEQAELSDTPFGKLTIDAISRLMRLNLMEGQRVWPKEMVDYVLGASGEWEAAEFFKANLADGWDLRIRPDSGLPQGRSARLEMVTKLAQFNMLGSMEDPKNSKSARKLARVWTDDEAYDPDKQDEVNAKNEEAAFQNGEARGVKEFDDDVVHIEYHLGNAKVRAQQEFDDDPTIVQSYLEEEAARMEHIQAHMERAQADQMPPEGMMPPEEGMPPQGM